MSALQIAITGYLFVLSLTAFGYAEYLSTNGIPYRVGVWVAIVLWPLTVAYFAPILCWRWGSDYVRLLGRISSHEE